jgi:hypothetical protein
MFFNNKKRNDDDVIESWISVLKMKITYSFINKKRKKE